MSYDVFHRELGDTLVMAEYNLDRQTAQDAMIKRYFTHKRVKVILQTLLLSVFAILSVISIFFMQYEYAQYDYLSVLVLVACAVGLFSVYYFPISSAKQSGARFDHRVYYTFELFDAYAAVTANGHSRSLLPYRDIYIVTENKDYYYIEIDKRLFPITKAEISPEKQAVISKTFSEKLGKKYKKY